MKEHKKFRDRPTLTKIIIILAAIVGGFFLSLLILSLLVGLLWA